MQCLTIPSIDTPHMGYRTHFYKKILITPFTIFQKSHFTLWFRLGLIVISYKMEKKIAPYSISLSHGTSNNITLLLDLYSYIVTIINNYFFIIFLIVHLQNINTNL